MANYTVDNDIVGGGLNGLGLGGGSWGMIILLFLFFAIFCGGGLFGNRNERRDADAFPGNWLTDRDIKEAQYAEAVRSCESTASIIANQNALAARSSDTELADAKTTILHERTLRAIESSENNTEREIGWMKNHMAEKPPVYAEAYLPSGVHYPNRGFENGG